MLRGTMAEVSLSQDIERGRGQLGWAHPGTCPKMPVLQTFVPCNHTCTDDRQCPPEEKCCYDGCGRSCLPPVRRSRCQLPAEPGPCQVLQPRYFYSPNHGRCQVFFYGGCQGNANNFRSRSECHRVCIKDFPQFAIFI
uniref:BPTI/Kunitz inhibitor domain-containing protein n=1 Tax=Pseudonaja textilis TaxID=8673 RepID=A0A670ZLH8_PSETE